VIQVSATAIEQLHKPVSDSGSQAFEQDFSVWTQQVAGRTLRGYYSTPPVADTDQPQICWLHGNGFNSRAYAPILQALIRPAENSPGFSGFSVFTTDIPGHGLSAAPARRWPHWRSMAKTVEQAMVQQCADQPARRRVGVGHSLGAILTLLQAHQHSDRFERILLLDPVLFPRNIMMAQQTLKILGLWDRMPLPKATRKRSSQWDSRELMQQQLAEKGFYRGWHPEALHGYVRGGHRATATGVELSCAPEWEARIFASYPTRLMQAIKQVKIPVHIICASNSFPFVLSGARRAASLNPNISYQLWGEGHCFPMEQAQATAALVRHWLEE
jgi:pimeloyl-ACP methyl ester carboxylesterase